MSRAEGAVRSFVADDVEGVLESWEAASAVAHPFLSEEFLASERRNIPEMYLPNTETWVWDTGKQVAGFISLFGVEGGQEVGAIFVRPEYHGKGIGRALMDHAREIHGPLEVEVFKENGIGRKFYDQYGFTLVEEKVHEGTGFALLRLRLA